MPDALKGLDRVGAERELVGVAAHFLGRVFVADSVFIPIHTISYVLWMGIFKNHLGRGFIEEEKCDSEY
jgi:hypothetical protein